jgi:hypothetical protein
LLPVELFDKRKVVRYIINEFNEDDLKFLNQYSDHLYSPCYKESEQEDQYEYNYFVFKLTAKPENDYNYLRISQNVSTGLIKAIIDGIEQGYDEVEFVI